MGKKQITIHLPVELMKELEREADEKGYTIRDLIVFILWGYFGLTIAPK